MMLLRSGCSGVLRGLLKSRQGEINWVDFITVRAR